MWYHCIEYLVLFSGTFLTFFFILALCGQKTMHIAYTFILGLCFQNFKDVAWWDLQLFRTMICVFVCVWGGGVASPSPISPFSCRKYVFYV